MKWCKNLTGRISKQWTWLRNRARPRQLTNDDMIKRCDFRAKLLERVPLAAGAVGAAMGYKVGSWQSIVFVGVAAAVGMLLAERYRVRARHLEQDAPPRILRVSRDDAGADRYSSRVDK